MLLPAHLAPGDDAELPLVYRGHLLRGGDEPDGTVYALAGSLRIRVTGETVEWARDLTLHPIRAHARDGQRWFFATNDGALFRSDTFTGPLTRVGETGGRELTAGFDSTSVLTTRAGDDTLWLGGPGDTFRAAPAPADGPLVDTGFVDRSFGVSVIAPGRLLRTIDGGAHFEPVDLGSEATYVVFPNVDGFVLATTGGLMHIGPTGPAMPHPGSSGVLDHSVPEDIVRAIRSSFLADFALAPQVLVARGGVVLPGGRVAAIETGEMVTYNPRSLASRLELPARGQHCALIPFGTHVLARCDEDYSRALYLSDGERPWTELRRFSGDVSVVAGADGESIVVLGGCETSEHGRDDSSVCWYDGQTWRTRDVAERPRLIGVHGEVLLYRTSEFSEASDAESDDEPIRALRLSDSEPARAVLVEIPGAHLSTAAFTSEGLVFGVAQHGSRRYSAVGSIESPLALRPLPHDATDLAFADAQHAIAAGPTLGEVWTSTDGARTWSPLVLPVDGDASSVTIDDGPVEDETSHEVSCQASVCIVGSRLIWSPNIAPGYRSFAARRAPTRTGNASVFSPRDDGFRAGPWSCHLANPPPGPMPRTDAPSDPPTRLYGGDGWLEPHLSMPRDPVSGRFAFAWGSTDERGRFRASARAGDLPQAMPISDSTPDEWRLVPRLLTRTLALLERCAPLRTRMGTGMTISQMRCSDLVVAPRGGLPRVVTTLASVLDTTGFLPLPAGFSAQPEIRSVLPLRDGGAAVLVTLRFIGPFGGSDSRIDAVIQLDARGNITARRGFAWSQRPDTRMLAAGPGGPGLVVATLPSPRTLTFYGLDAHDEGHTLATLPASSLDACARPSDSRSTAVAASARFYGPELLIHRYSLQPFDHLRPVLELAVDGTVCFRSASFWAMDPTDADEREFVAHVGGAFHMRAVNGNMLGSAIDRDRDRAIACRRP